MCSGQVPVAGVKSPGSRHGSALPPPLIHCATATDDQVGTFPDKCGDRESPLSGKVFQLLHLGFRKLDLRADHEDPLDDTDTIIAITITFRWNIGK